MSRKMYQVFLNIMCGNNVCSSAFSKFPFFSNLRHVRLWRLLPMLKTVSSVTNYLQNELYVFNFVSFQFTLNIEYRRNFYCFFLVFLQVFSFTNFVTYLYGHWIRATKHFKLFNKSLLYTSFNDKILLSKEFFSWLAPVSDKCKKNHALHRFT